MREKNHHQNGQCRELDVLKNSFASSPGKLITNYVLEWMGLNFYDYDGLQPKMTHTKHSWGSVILLVKLNFDQEIKY